MQIEKDRVVLFHYTLSNAQGQQLESSYERQPMAYLHGHDNILSGLEQALAGKQAGDSLSVTLSPEQAYGERVEEAEQRVPVKHLQGAKKWRPGMVAVVHTEQGARQVTVKKVGKFMVTVDTNHPLAGETLTFAIEVVEVRAASAEEIAHGHAHGVGGHHH
ncbi:FKBP-type peptidyl-prolyl cis-trans isomerase [Balneatrix alpica]|uniref:Peptidyl-prolyl cis-trans isomerase n=1 Tax=Balneatrix alpica TaxID=75684 RepID=A0ABV5ZBV4_9GAMM|nr:peptidylprolyl isomerase [Balneatrix alpica]